MSLHWFTRLFHKEKETSGVDTDPHLQEVNEELYKRNLELAIKNQTLTLFSRLYEVGSRTLDIDELSQKLAASIAEILLLPFVSICIIDHESQTISPRAATSTVWQGKSLMRVRKKGEKKHIMLPKHHVCTKVLAEGKKQETGDFVAIAKSFVEKTAVEELIKKGVKANLLFPLRSGDTKFGVLILSLDRSFQELNTFEQEAIHSLVDVVSIAVDKSIAYENLQYANIRLKELDQQKTEFLSIASHQLRTPLSIIKGYLELMLDGAYGKVNTKTKKIINDMDQSNERLVKLVDEFLDITRLEQGRTKYSFDTYNMVDMVTDVVKELKPRAKSKKIRVDWKPKTKKQDVYIDEEKIRNVIFNYIDNAIKYTEKGHVHIDVAHKDDGVEVIVTDTGVGFGKEDEANFFQKFYRGKNVENTNVNGTGLGIYVCRKFIEAHGGHVWAHSAGSGKGSEFGLWLPDKTGEKAKVLQQDELSGVMHEIVEEKDTSTLASVV